MYYQDAIDDRYIMNRRAAWKAEMKSLAEKGDFTGVLRLMAKNYGDRGDVFSLIENFTANADPWTGSDDE